MADYIVKENLFSDEASRPGKTVFFPGCSLVGFGPKLVEEVFDCIQRERIAEGILHLCCGKMLDYIESPFERDRYEKQLAHALMTSGVEKLVVFCPSCYYSLTRMLSSYGDHVPEVVALPEALLEKGVVLDGKAMESWKIATVHDSCPDRNCGRFGASVRKLLSHADLREMSHSGKTSMCCSSNPDGAREFFTEYECSVRRLSEASAIDADVVFAYCARCAHMLSDASVEFPSLTVRHYLDILLDDEFDWKQEPLWSGCVLLDCD